MAGSQPSKEALDARVAVAKARLVALAEEAERRPAVVDRAAAVVRLQPWRGVGIALLVGFYLGLTRGAGLRVVAPVVTPLLGGFALNALRGVGIVPPGATVVTPTGAAAGTTDPPTTVRVVPRP